MTVNTSCSSALAALHIAKNALRTRDCDLAVVGGINLVLFPFWEDEAPDYVVRSPQYRCASYDAEASGIIGGEGVAVVVLKRLSDANRNATDQWVLSGHRKALQEAGERLESLGGVVKPLNISIPAHSLLMAPIVPQFEEAIRQASPKDCQIPIISCISCVEYTASHDIITMLSNQLTGTVNWPLTVSTLLARGGDTVIEAGPKTILRDLIREAHPGIRTLSLGTVEDKNAVQHFLSAINRYTATDLSGAGFSHAQIEAFLLSCLRFAVGTPCLKDLSPVSFQQTVQLPYQKLVGDLDAIRESRSAQIDPTLLRRTARSTLSLLHAKGLYPDQYKALLEQAAASQEIHDAIAEYLL